MSETARQFNIMSETLRRGIAGMEDSANATKRLGIQQEQMEYGIERDERNFAAEQERFGEQKRQYEERRSDQATAREAADVEHRQTIEADKERREWEKQDGGAQAVGIDLQDPTNVAWIVPGGSLERALWQQRGIETRYEDIDGDGVKDLRFYQEQSNGKMKKMSNKFMSSNSVALTFASEYDYAKHQRGVVEKSRMDMQELVNRGVPETNDAYKLAAKSLQEAEIKQKDMRDHPSKYEHEKSQKVARIHGRMRPAFQEMYQPIVDLQEAKFENALKMDLLTQRATGKNLRNVTMTKRLPNGNVNQISVPFHNSETLDENNDRYMNKVKQGYGLETLKATPYQMEVADKQGLQKELAKYTNYLQRSQAAGGYDAFVDGLKTEQEKKEMSEYPSAVSAQEDFKKRIRDLKQQISLPEGVDNAYIETLMEKFKENNPERTITRQMVIDSLSTGGNR